MKKAVLTLDVEDWYHLDYFDRHECDTENSLLDGLYVYVELLDSLSLPSSFFVLGEIAERKVNFFQDLIKAGHDVGSHGWNHIRPNGRIWLSRRGKQMRHLRFMGNGASSAWT